MNISFATPFVFWMKIWENALSGRDPFDTNDPMTASMKKRSAAAGAEERYTPATAKDIWQEAEIATIERCAQVAETTIFGNPPTQIHKDIAAAIRALKDQS